MSHKLEVMLELERRGALPKEKSEILAELRRRGSIPDLKDSPVSEVKGGFEVPISGSSPVSDIPLTGEIFSPPGLLDVPPVDPLDLPLRALGGFLGGNFRPDPPGHDIGDLAEIVGREALPTAAGMVAAPGGPLAIGGAEAAGRAIQRGIGGIVSHFRPDIVPPTSTGEKLGDVALTGTLGFAVPAGFKGIEKLAPAFRRVGGQIIRVFSGVPHKQAEAALGGALRGAPTIEAASQAFEDLFASQGLKSIGTDPFSATGRNIPTTSDYSNLFETAINKLRDGTLTLQDAVYGSQAATKLKQLAKFGNPEQAVAARSLNSGKVTLDKFIEDRLPGYAAARQGFLKSKVAEAFEPILPQNKIGTPSVLRTQAAAATATAGFLGGNPLLALALPLASPRAVGLGIRAGDIAFRGARRLAPAIGPVLETRFSGR